MVSHWSDESERIEWTCYVDSKKKVLVSFEQLLKRNHNNLLVVQHQKWSRCWPHDYRSKKNESDVIQQQRIIKKGERNKTGLPTDRNRPFGIEQTEKRNEGKSMENENEMQEEISVIQHMDDAVWSDIDV